MEDIKSCESCWKSTPGQSLIQCWHCGLFVCQPCYKRAHDCEPSHHPTECKSLQLWTTAGQNYRDKLRANSLQWARLRQPGYICKEEEEEETMTDPKTLINSKICNCNPDKPCLSESLSDDLTGLARWEDFAAQTVDSDQPVPTSKIVLTLKSEDPHLRIKAVHTVYTADGQDIITITLVRR